MKRALSTALAVVGFVGVAAAPAHAYQAPPPVVTYTIGDDNVAVGTGLPGQPLLGARADLGDGTVCVGFSYQVPQCVDLEPIELSTS
ncbi:MAG TPA: hypothetical protein VNA14_05380 [Mycobacteriales bacterium]|nr:hypothetical protein [Mycobacteriales bacterium]